MVVVVSNISYFHPEIWGRVPSWRVYFSDRLKPPTRLVGCGGYTLDDSVHACGPHRYRRPCLPAYLVSRRQFYWPLPSQSLTWNLKMMVSKRNLLFQGAIFRFHVKFWEGKRSVGKHRKICWNPWNSINSWEILGECLVNPSKMPWESFEILVNRWISTHWDDRLFFTTMRFYEFFWLNGSQPLSSQLLLNP